MVGFSCNHTCGSCSLLCVPLVLLTTLLLTTPANSLQPPDTELSVTKADDPVPLLQESSVVMSMEQRGAFGLKMQLDKVMHNSALNKRSTWLFMGMAVLCVAAAVFRIEVASSSWEPVNFRRAFGKGQGDAESLLAPEQEDKRQAQSPDDKGKRDEWQDFSHLIFCAVALNISMLLWGISQEFVMSNKYEDAQGKVETVPSTLNIVLWNRFSTFLFSGLVLAIQGKPWHCEGMAMNALPAASNACAAWCQYSSLQYISFALQTTAKTTKLAPVLIIDGLRGKAHSVVDYVEAIVLVSALLVFGLEMEGGTGGMTTMTGVLLLVGLIAADSFTPHCQDAMFTAYPEMAPLQATFAMAGFASVGIILFQLCNGMLFASWAFLARHPEAILHVAVLASSSTMTQYFITYTIKHHGPVVFTLLVSVRQIFSVGISAVIFQHKISHVAMLAMAMVFCMVIGRAIRPRNQQQDSAESAPLAERPLTPRTPGRPVYWWADWLRWVLNGRAGYKKFCVCAIGILSLYAAYAVAQEYLSVHSFRQTFFRFPLFIIAVNHTCSALFGFGLLYLQGLPAFVPASRLTLLPAGAGMVATFVQHAALHHMGFPAQSVMKSVGIVPVMLIGKLLGNREAKKQDYAEALFITFMVLSLSWNLNLVSIPSQSGLAGVSLMLLIAGYVVSSSLTCNFEDVIYQYENLNPAQMLLGLELASGAVAWIVIFFSGDLFYALKFIAQEPGVLLSIGLLALAASAGAYMCTLTVRLFGPGVFALLKTCRQMLSLAISLALFDHGVNWKSCLCLIPVSMMALHSCVRQVGQGTPRESRGLEKGTPQESRGECKAFYEAIMK